MNNGQNVARSRHLEELARAAKQYTLQEILDMTEAVAAELGGLSLANHDDFTGATSITGGLSGLVPAPQAGDESKFLRGDGSWSTVESDDTPVPKFYYGGETYAFGGSSGIVTPDYSEYLVRYLPFENSATEDTCGNTWTATGNVSLEIAPVKFGATLNQWIHIAIVKSGTTITFYKDGQTVASHTLTETPRVNTYFWLGATLYGAATDVYFDNVRFFEDVAL